MKKWFKKVKCLPIVIILIMYTIISFINLGSFKNPNTFLDVGQDEEILIELKNATYINKIKYFSGRIGEEYDLLTSLDGVKYDSVFELKTSAFSWQEEKIYKTAKYLRFRRSSFIR